MHDFHKKNTETYMALHKNFSGLRSTTNPVKVSKDGASFVACTSKYFFG